MSKADDRRRKRESKPSWERNQNARARAIARRVFELASRRPPAADALAMNDGLIELWNDPYGNDGDVDETIRRDRTRTRAMLPSVSAITYLWRHRVPRCGQCGETEPENPCGGPCNAKPF